MNPFEFLDSINVTKTDLFKEGYPEKDYPAWLVNRGLSYFPDTVFYANEMNRFPQLDKKLQYDFLLSSIAKRKRFSKWSKKESSDQITLVKEYYKCSDAKAMEALSILTEENLKQMAEILSTGGRRK